MVSSPLSPASSPSIKPSSSALSAQKTPALRFPKAQRLKKPQQFQQVYRSKQWGNSALYSFNVLAQQIDSSPAVLGVTVSKKVAKNAVDRNRIKRQIKEFFRLRQHQIKDAHVVITAKPSCLRASDQQRLESLQQLWSKLLSWQRWNEKQQAAKKC